MQSECYLLKAAESLIGFRKLPKIVSESMGKRGKLVGKSLLFLVQMASNFGKGSPWLVRQQTFQLLSVHIKILEIKPFEGS